MKLTFAQFSKNHNNFIIGPKSIALIGKNSSINEVGKQQVTIINQGLITKSAGSSA